MDSQHALTRSLGWRLWNARSPGGGVYPSETWHTSNQLHGASVFPLVTSQHSKLEENMFS